MKDIDKEYQYPTSPDRRRSLSRAEVRKREIRDGRHIRDKHPSKWTADDLRRLRTIERAARRRGDHKIAMRALELVTQVKAELSKRGSRRSSCFQSSQSYAEHSRRGGDV
jgi:uncharacterized protein YcbK (DUF882 family)